MLLVGSLRRRTRGLGRKMPEKSEWHRMSAHLREENAGDSEIRWLHLGLLWQEKIAEEGLNCLRTNDCQNQQPPNLKSGAFTSKSSDNPDGTTSNSDKDNTTRNGFNWPLQLHHTLTFQSLWQICTADPQGEMGGRKAWHIISFPGSLGE